MFARRFSFIAAVIVILVAGVVVAVAEPVLVRATGKYNVLPCNLTADETHSVIGVKDGATIVVDGGSLVRLSGILVPVAPRSALAFVVWPPEQAAKTALEALVVGRTVTVAFVTPKRDRFGTAQAHLFIGADANGGALATGASEAPKSYTWVQESLLSSGNARAFEPAGQSDCFTDLMSFEQSARESGVGLWAHDAYRALRSGNTARLLKLRGSFVRVRGRVQTVAVRSLYTYLNFGENWRTDFTIVVPRRVLRAHPVWAKNLGELALATVEVQGWIRSRNGPNIELDHRAQLRVLDSGARSGGLNRP